MRVILGGVVITVVGVLQLTQSWMRGPSWDVPAYRTQWARRHPKAAGVLIIAVGVCAIVFGVADL